MILMKKKAPVKNLWDIPVGKKKHTKKSSKNGNDLKPSNQDQKIKNPKFKKKIKKLLSYQST